MEDQDEVAPEFFDVPSADPQIQKDYEAALGAFLVAFNRIENAVNDIIVLALQKSERQDILKHLSNDLFHRKLTTLDLISLAYSRPLPKTVVNELRDLASQRNDLAHGHFHQNPFDGSYKIVAKRKPFPMSTDQLNLFTKRADGALDVLRYAQAYFWFDDDEENA